MSLTNAWVAAIVVAAVDEGMSIDIDDNDSFTHLFVLQTRDEDIPTLSPVEDVAVQDKPNEVRIGPMTRARTKLLAQ